MPGVPSVGDRVAQTVAALALEPRMDAIFHDDSYGYRPRRGALDAVTVCRQRCWEKSWVIDLDIRKFFDSLPWVLIVKAVQANTTHEQRWIVLYVRRWLAAPIAMPDGRLEERDAGPRRGLRIVPSSLTCSCILRSASGWNESSRQSSSRFADEP